MNLYPSLNKHPFFTESVYNWVYVDDTEFHEGETLYRSKYSSAVKKFYEDKKSAIPKTMGSPQSFLSPQNYLRKRSGEKKMLAETKPASCFCRETKRMTQSTEDIKTEEMPSVQKIIRRDFISENSLQMLKRPATVPEPRIVDDRKGHSIVLEESGLVPKYIYKEDYGHKPSYIENIERDLAESRAKFRDFLLAEQQMTAPERMSEETKQEIYEGLVRNLKELLRRYRMLPVRTETPLQLKRKVEIEKRMDCLEQDIELLVRHKDIFIGKGCTFRR